MSKIKRYFELSADIIKNLVTFEKEISEVTKLIFDCYKSQNKILVGGNGGSSSDADHFVGELQCTFRDKDRPPISALSLSNSLAAMTAWSNDFNFNSYFERQVKAHGRKDDLLILISTSGGFKKGQSSNLILAAEEAKRKKMHVISLIGKTGGDLKKISDTSIHIENDVTALIQQAHMTILHCICENLEELMK